MKKFRVWWRDFYGYVHTFDIICASAEDASYYASEADNWTYTIDVQQIK
jgi:hypothetical protein